MAKARPALTLADWLAALALGIILGTLVLGVGGRVAMRWIGLLQGQPTGFSVGGSATVVFLGAVSGLAGAVAFVALRFFVRERPVLRAGLFSVILLLVTLRGLRPIDAHRLALFLPLVALYGTTLQLLWCRGYRQRRILGTLRQRPPTR